MTRRLLRAVFVLLWMPALAAAQAPVTYRLSFPEAEHRWMQVQVRFDELPPGPLELRMSRASPGRYAVHDFAKNVYDVQIAGTGGAPLTVIRATPHEWTVIGHSGRVEVSYRIFGDRIDGTYLAIDSTHAHINMPAALMWARGLEDRPAIVQLESPRGASWRVATQLLPGADALTYAAPNFSYLMDSPTEFSAFSLRTFTVGDAPGAPVFRLAVHHTGTDSELDGFAADVEKIVREARHVFGEYPAFEGNAYTFIADYLPWAAGDGMEHRNSTILTSGSSIRSNRLGLLDTVSHEFFHTWNVERIRPRALEPFDFNEANVSGELWLGEGFTSYYGPLVLLRAGVIQLSDFVSEIEGLINDVRLSPGRLVRSAEGMSRMAPLADGAGYVDRTNFAVTYLSYYTWGAAIGLGLDLTLRDRSNGRVTLDDYMRALWQRHGKPGGTRPGYVDTPYTMADLVAALAAVSGDAAFASDFFARYIQGSAVVDYERLLPRAGFVVRPAAPGQGWIGELRLQDAQGGARVTAAVPFGSPAYAAGLERDDVIVAIGGRDVSSAADMTRAVRERKPGDTVSVTFDRRGQRITGTARLATDPRVEISPVEQTGREPAADERRFRNGWLSSAARNAF
ncbi:MAG: M61 family metallopeptidase [Acidobacteria bacterium]|nr:M61 family metallopeptidase [Acidobacteriota bacterium]